MSSLNMVPLVQHTTDSSHEQISNPLSCLGSVNEGFSLVCAELKSLGACKTTGRVDRLPLPGQEDGSTRLSVHLY